VVAAIKHFRFMLEGRSFTVFTDHRPLLGALSRRTDPWSGRQQHHLSFIAEFLLTVRHIAGQSNVVVDTLSRPTGGLLATPRSAQSEEGRSPPSGSNRVAAKYRTEVKVPSGSSVPVFAAKSVQVASMAASSPPSSSPVDLAVAQPSCPDCQRASSSSALRVTTIQMENSSIMVDTSSGVLRPLVPAPFRRLIFDAVHNPAHPGVYATRRLIASWFVWSAMPRRWRHGAGTVNTARGPTQWPNPPRRRR
jgi:hypothetical protein